MARQGILVTGGAGYIGSSTLQALQLRGYAPVCLDNLSTGYRELAGAAPFLQGDLGRPEDLDRVFSEHAIAAVIHFASHALVEESYRNPHKYYHDNIANALNLLEAMKRHGVRLLVFSSSCATYGIPRRIPMDETLPLDPVNPYGVTKMVVERILGDYQNAHGFRHVALRYFNAAGAAHDAGTGEWHVPESHLIPRLLEIALCGKGHAEVYGCDYPTPDGTCVRDYVHVADLASAHIAALDYLFAGEPPEIFNLGTGEGFSVLQVVAEVERITGARIPTAIRERRPGDPPELVADPRKAQGRLGWKARHSSLPEVIETAWNWRRGPVCAALAARHPLQTGQDLPGRP